MNIEEQHTTDRARRKKRELSRRLCLLSWIVGVLAFAAGSVPGVTVSDGQYYFLLPFLGLFVANYFGRRYTDARYERPAYEPSRDSADELINALRTRAEAACVPNRTTIEETSTRSMEL